MTNSSVRDSDNPRQLHYQCIFHCFTLAPVSLAPPIEVILYEPLLKAVCMWTASFPPAVWELNVERKLMALFYV